MRPRRLVAPHDAAEMFDQAVREHALAVVSFQQGTDWLTFKSRFLECDPRGRFFVLDHPGVADRPLPDILPGQYVGVSFRQKSRKILFATVVQAKGHFVLSDNSTVPAVRYRWPTTLTELQRRAYYRTPVPPEMKLLVSLWSGGVAARARAQAHALHIVTGDLANLSCGGALVQLHANAPPRWAEDDVLGAEVQLPDGRPPIQVDARFRGIRPDEGGVLAAAIQFIGLELSVDARLVLQRLAGSVQRLHRMSMATGRPTWHE